MHSESNETTTVPAPQEVKGSALSKWRDWIPWVALAALWWVLIDSLRVEWTVNPQYGYGWVVPVLCLFMAFRRWEERMQARGNGNESAAKESSPNRWIWVVACTGAVLILPIRLFLEANPGWRTIQWVLALIVVGLTLIWVGCRWGRAMSRHLAFPVAFILIAVPWPVSIEQWVIQGLTVTNVALAIEALGIMGIPAQQHGAIIEIHSGVVGVDEACSGIRSFQSSLMIALVMGEWFRFGWLRRLGLCLAGAVLAYAFNVVRTGLLVWVASTKGIDAIDAWHDPAGLTILLACVGALMGLSWILAKWKPQEPAALDRQRPNPVTIHPANENPGTPRETGPRAGLFRYSWILIAWILLSEIGVEGWFRWHERGLESAAHWTVNWPPKDAPGFEEIVVPRASREMLKYDEGWSGRWRPEPGVEVAAYVFRWQPGRTAPTAARSHSPDVCLTAAGKTLVPVDDERRPTLVDGLRFPFRYYRFDEGPRRVHVLHCLWEERAPGNYAEVGDQGGMMAQRWRNVTLGQRNLGQRSIEFMILGARDEVHAMEIFQGLIGNIVEVIR